MADHTDGLALPDLEVDVAQSPELTFVAQALSTPTTGQAAHEVRHQVAQRVKALALAEALGNAVEADRNVAHEVRHCPRTTAPADETSARPVRTWRSKPQRCMRSMAGPACAPAQRFVPGHPAVAPPG